MDSDKLNQTQNDDNNNSINEEDIKKYRQQVKELDADILFSLNQNPPGEN